MSKRRRLTDYDKYLIVCLGFYAYTYGPHIKRKVKSCAIESQAKIKYNYKLLKWKKYDKKRIEKEVENLNKMWNIPL